MNPRAILDVAEEVSRLLQDGGDEVLLIGALALAAHGYVRETRDVDLGSNASLPRLRAIADQLRRKGYVVELREPDGDDPLSGVLDVSGPFGLVQVVSFGGTFPAVIRDAAEHATLVVAPGSSLRIVPLPQLVAMKLYAGGLRSKADVAELLARNPDVELDEVRAACARYRLGDELAEVLAGP